MYGKRNYQQLFNVEEFFLPFYVLQRKETYDEN